MRTHEEVRAFCEEAHTSWEATSDQKSFHVFITLLWVLGADIQPSLANDGRDKQGIGGLPPAPPPIR